MTSSSKESCRVADETSRQPFSASIAPLSLEYIMPASHSVVNRGHVRMAVERKSGESDENRKGQHVSMLPQKTSGQTGMSIFKSSSRSFVFAA
jgi:hypothetical protein